MKTLNQNHKEKIAQSVKRHWESIRNSLDYIQRCEKMSKNRLGISTWNKGKHIYLGGGFKKGQVPWNKGLKGVMPVPWNRGKNFLQITGERNCNWRGGITFDIYHRVRTMEWKRIAKEILKRDNFICKNCGALENLSVHHIIPYRIIQDDRKENLITLCKSCHTFFDSKFRREEKW